MTSDAGPDPRPDLYEHLHVGQVIEGKVTRHAPFGIFVDIGDPHSPGLAEFPDEYPRGMADFPAIGSQLTCVVVGFRRLQPDERMQAQVSLRPSRLRAAACVGRVEALPPEHRFAFFRKLMADGGAALTEAAAWRARLVPEQDRLPLLLEALAHPGIEVKIRAVDQVGDLPTRDRSIFLQEVLRQDNPAVAEAAVWQAGTLPLPARTAFLDLASRHSLPNVADRARWYVRFRDKEPPPRVIWPSTARDTRLAKDSTGSLWVGWLA